jgi:hypothetical protein
MADLIARETMKALDNQIGPKRQEPRKSTVALYTEGHVNFGVLDRNYCQGWRAAVDRFNSELNGTSDYLTWLSQNRLVDNFSNRIRYMERLDA